MLKAAGALLLALGLLMGVLLTVGPLGFWTAPAGWGPLVLFTVLTAGGYLLIALDSTTAALPSLARVAGSLLLALAILAALGLVLVAGSFIAPAGSTLSLWFVLGVGAVFGAASLMAHRPIAA